MLYGLDRFIIIVLSFLHIVCIIERLINLLLLLLFREPKYPTFAGISSKFRCDDDYPMIAIQLPMMNEIECYEGVIDSACNFDWPKNRLIIQVLDDSTDEVMKVLVDQCVEKWRNQGKQIAVHRRVVRHGFKAGNLNSGLKLIPDAEYIAIFDVDFRPYPDFLKRTMPILIEDSRVAFVQGRWTFLNAQQSLLTRMQNMLLNFHHKCEQAGRSRASLFFTFNGTGGIWRKKTIDDIGGWHTNTLVEDLDLSVRAYVHGWRSVYLSDVECPNELPSTLSAYYLQQHRWSSGPMQVLQKMLRSIREMEKISRSRKFFCLLYVFRCFIHVLIFWSLIIITLLYISLKQTSSLIYLNTMISSLMSLLYACWSSKDILGMWLSIILSNAMSLHHTVTIVQGLVNHLTAHRWIVTPKMGDTKTKTVDQLVGPAASLVMTNRCKRNAVTLEKKASRKTWFMWIEIGNGSVIHELLMYTICSRRTYRKLYLIRER